MTVPSFHFPFNIAQGLRVHNHFFKYKVFTNKLSSCYNVSAITSQTHISKGENEMMNIAMPVRNVYEDFDLQTDILFFKLGNQGLVSFHGKNYNRKKRMSAAEVEQLVHQKGFYRISSNCYINIAQIKSITSGTISFGSDCAESKQVNVNRRKQYVIQQLFTQWSANKEWRITT